MPERWQSELRKLRDLSAPEKLPLPRRDSGVVGPSRRQRGVALVVAVGVFAGAGLFVWRAFKPVGGSVAGGSPASEGRLPPSAARISCREHKTVVLDRVVRPQPDGVHL